MERIIILGIGNPLVRDEGVGVRVAEELSSGYEFPQGVEVQDAGTMGMTMLSTLCSADFAVVIDAVDGTGHPPGTVVTMSAEQIAPAQVLHSAHDMRFANVLEAAALIGKAPEARVVGVQIKQLEVGTVGLTPEVESAVPRAVAAVLELLAERGVAPLLRS